MEYSKLKEGQFSFVYLTTKACNVCKILEPKLRTLAKDYSQSEFTKIYLDDYPDAKGEFMAFSFPTFVVYSDRKELVRAARHMSIDEIKSKLDRYHDLIFG